MLPVGLPSALLWKPNFPVPHTAVAQGHPQGTLEMACLRSQQRENLRSTWLSATLGSQHATRGAWGTCSQLELPKPSTTYTVKQHSLVHITIPSHHVPAFKFSQRWSVLSLALQHHQDIRSASLPGCSGCHKSTETSPRNMSSSHHSGTQGVRFLSLVVHAATVGTKACSSRATSTELSVAQAANILSPTPLAQPQSWGAQLA